MHRRSLQAEMVALIEFVYGAPEPELLMVDPSRNKLCIHGRVFCHPCGRLYRDASKKKRLRARRDFRVIREDEAREEDHDQG